jgi:hypothetical protein
MSDKAMFVGVLSIMCGAHVGWLGIQIVWASLTGRRW